MRVFKSKVYKRIIFSYISLLLIPTVVIGVVGSLRTGSIVYEQIQKTNMSSVHSVRQEFSTWLDMLGQFPAKIGNMPPMKRFYTVVGDLRFDNSSVMSVRDVESLKYELAACKQSVHAVREIAVVFRKGNIVVDSNGYYSKEDYFHNKYIFTGSGFEDESSIDWTSSGARLYTDMTLQHYRESDDVWVYVQNITYPIASSASVLVVIDRAALLDSMRLDEQSPFVMADAQGNLMLSSGEGIEFVQLQPYLPQINEEVQRALRLHGAEYALYGMTDPDTGYRYMALFDMKSMTARVMEVVRFSVWVAVATLLLGLVIAFWEARRHYAPIRDIAQKLPAQQGHDRMNEYVSIQDALDSLQTENSRFRERVAEYVPVMRNNLLCHLLVPDEKYPVSEKELHACGIAFPHSCFCAAVIEVEVMDSTGCLEERAENNALSGLEISAFLKYCMEEELNTAESLCRLIQLQDGELVVLLNTQTREMGTVEALFTRLFALLRRKFADAGELIILVGCSDLHAGIADIPAAFAQARKAVAYRGMRAASDFIRYEDIRDDARLPYQFTFEQEQRLINLLKTGDQDACEDYVGNLLDQYFSQGRMRREDGLYIFNEILSTCIKVMHELSGLAASDISFCRLAGLMRFDDMNAYVLESIGQVCTEVRSRRKPHTDRLESDIIQWIDKNYTNNEISLTYLSAQFHISASYISRLIKDHLGVNFVEYLNKCRIARAKELLRDESILVKDIAALAGYDCDKNFRRVFKKYEGITPGEYRLQAEGVLHHSSHAP